MDPAGDAQARGPHRRDAARTRQLILDAARAAFAEHGYRGATVRLIAARAGVAPTLITRYFGGKAELFRAASVIDLGVVEAVPGAYSELGSRIAGVVMSRYEDGPTRDPLLMMMRSTGSRDAARQLGEYFAAQAARPLTARVASELACDTGVAADRVAAVGSLVLGVVLSRYVLEEGPLAEADPSRVAPWLGDVLQRLLDDPSPPSLGSPGGW